ncbi:MAG: 50S ribosomal protein L11 methyltransferase [Bacteroidetes bacterium]|nr:MAG: 50S ribosomal protein L11 methyltransferase [Bacteroidota bacterium]
MEQYIEVKFETKEDFQNEILIALLSEIGYEGFEEDGRILKAFIPESHFDEVVLKELAVKSGLEFSNTVIPVKNWNSIWESEFHPVVVNDFVGIRAGFHKSITGVRYEIVITPKMSFGTGHHDTTYMMIQSLENLDLKKKSVADFGTGTGILAILASKLGASKILGIDHDEWSIRNAEENFLENHVDNVSLSNTGVFPSDDSWDLILANINKLVILSNIKVISNTLAPGGILITSGYLLEDEADMLNAAESHGLSKLSIQRRNNWLCITFKKV